ANAGGRGRGGPRGEPRIASNRALSTGMWWALRGSGMPDPPVSAALIDNPLAAPRTTLLRNVTYSVTHHVQRPSWLTDFNRIAVPSCPDAQTCSKVLPSTRTWL